MKQVGNVQQPVDAIVQREGKVVISLFSPMSVSCVYKPLQIKHQANYRKRETTPM